MYNVIQCVSVLNNAYCSVILRLPLSASELSGIYLYEFTNNEREISIPHEATIKCGIENFEFIISALLKVNRNNSRAMSELTFLLFKLNTLQKRFVKVWVSWSHGVITVVYWIILHHGYYTTIMTSRRLLRHNPVSRGTNQPMRKPEFLQCKLNNKQCYTTCITVLCV